MTFKTLAMLGLIHGAVACASPAHPDIAGGISSRIEVEAGREFEIAAGQEAQVRGTPVTVRFTEVTNESRCPTDVQCVWAGNAVVRLSLSASGRPGADMALNTTLDPRTGTYAGYRISLTGLRPSPRSGSTIPPASYVATLEVRAIQGG